MKYAFIEKYRGRHSLRLLCRTFGLSRSNHYAHSRRVERRKANEAPVVQAMRTIHQERFKKHYGSPRMTRELQAKGFAINRKKVMRLMRQEGIVLAKKRRFCKTTDSKHSLPIAPNVLARDFAQGPVNQRWACDITYLHTPLGMIYLAVVLDIGTRKWVGYSVANHMRTSLCLDALEMALCHEGTAPAVHHSDRGSQYASEAYRARLKQQGITLSMSEKGNCWDNAISESFFGRLKTELGNTFSSLQDAQRELFDYWLFYNKIRLHSSLKFTNPEHYIKTISIKHTQAA